jgi:hypothetical protein
VGVLHATRRNAVGQVVQLEVTLLGKTSSSLYLQPIKQLQDSNASDTITLGIDQNIFPQVRWYGPVAKQQVSFLKSGTSSYLFLRNASGSIKMITRQDYLNIAGRKNLF